MNAGLCILREESSGLDWKLLRFRDAFQLMDQFSDLSRTARTQIVKSNTGSAPAVKSGDVAGDAELEMTRDKVDLHMRTPFEIDGGGSDEASGKAQVENLSSEEECSVRDKDLGIALAGVAGMTAAIRLR
jgi:hypothetical protein